MASDRPRIPFHPARRHTRLEVRIVPAVVLRRRHPFDSAVPDRVDVYTPKRTTPRRHPAAMTGRARRQQRKRARGRRAIERLLAKFGDAWGAWSWGNLGGAIGLAAPLP